MDTLNILKDNPLTLNRRSAAPSAGAEAAESGRFSLTLEKAIRHDAENGHQARQSGAGRQDTDDAPGSASPAAHGGKTHGARETESPDEGKTPNAGSLQTKHDPTTELQQVPGTAVRTTKQERNNDKAETTDSSLASLAGTGTEASAETDTGNSAVEPAASSASLKPLDERVESGNADPAIPPSKQDEVPPETFVAVQHEAARAEPKQAEQERAAQEIVVNLHDARLHPETAEHKHAAGGTHEAEVERGTDSALGYLQSILKRYSRHGVSANNADSADSTDSAVTATGSRNRAAVAADKALPAGDRTSQHAAAIELTDSFGKAADTVQLRYSPQTVLALAPELDGHIRQELPEVTGLRESFSTTVNQLSEARGAARTSSAPVLQLYSEQDAGSENWNRDIGAKITWLSSQRINKAEISLHPAELGALDITIDTDNDRICVTITTRNDAARELLESSLPRLADLLRNNGLTLEQGSVNQHKGSADGQGEGRFADGKASGGPGATGNEDQAEAELVTRRAVLHDGQVDHYV